MEKAQWRTKVDPFESDEEYEVFLADLYASRRACEQ